MPRLHQGRRCIGFNVLNHVRIEAGALLGVSSRPQPGVVLRAGYPCFPGKSLNGQAKAFDRRRVARETGDRGRECGPRGVYIQDPWYSSPVGL